MRKKIAAANWKMNLTIEEGKDLFDALFAEEHEVSEDKIAVIAVPFPYLAMAKEKIGDKKFVYCAAQNVYTKNNGAYTGEVSATMLASMEIQYALVGHSERREYFNEHEAMLAEKVDACLRNNIVPIFCCGEPKEIREGNTQNEHVETQIASSLFHLSEEEMGKVVIAYEPIWAIGTGLTASSEQAQEMHKHIRSLIAEKYGESIGENISILYGGSVKPSNAEEIFSKPDVDGGLVGGASLVAADFAAIIRSL